MGEGMCRLCCKSDNVLLEVFVDVTEEISLAAKIFVCFGVKIQEDDAITKRICKSCYFFTNSAYEYRISAQQNDVKLKKAYEETLMEDEITSQSISQDDFLNTLNLANKKNVNEKPKEPQYHPSVQRLKRKYPEINIPASCHRINIEPVVYIDNTDIDQWNNKLTNLGIWAEIISESLQNMGSNEHANTDSDGNEKQLDRPVNMAIEHVQSDDSSTEINQMKISSVQSLSEQEVSDEILPTKFLTNIPEDEHDSDSMSYNNDNNLLMATGQDLIQKFMKM
ncbi:hypothetical protein CBL_08880 [Carabus blaptoides fortunei]